MSSATKFRLTGRERWRLKKWYTVISPQVFGSIPVTSTPGDEPWKLLGRTIEITLYDLTGDITQVHVHLYLQIYKVDPEREEAYTIFKGHELARDYIRSLTRRKSSKIVAIFNATTKDGYVVRPTVATWTTYRCNTSQRCSIRKIMMDLVAKRASERTFDEFVNDMIFGDFVQTIFNEVKKVYPVRKVEFVKSKLLAVPTPEGQKKAIVVPKPGVLETTFL